jgi:hypothetical protein
MPRRIGSTSRMAVLAWIAGYLIALAWAVAGAWVLLEVGPPLLLSTWWVAAPAAFWTFARRRAIHLRHTLLGGLSCGSRVAAVYMVAFVLIVFLELRVLALLLSMSWVLLVVVPIIVLAPSPESGGAARSVGGSEGGLRSSDQQGGR